MNSECVAWKQFSNWIKNVEGNQFKADFKGFTGGAALKIATLPSIPFNLVFGTYKDLDQKDVDDISEWYFADVEKFGFKIIPNMDNRDLIKELLAKGFEFSNFQNVVVRELPSHLPEAFSDHKFHIRAVTSENLSVFQDVLVKGFEATGIFADYLRKATEFMLETSAYKHYLCYDLDKPVGTGTIFLGNNKVANLENGSVLLEHRGKRIQQMLIDHRVQVAQEAGYDYVMSTTPGYDTGFRNLERNGFRLAYNALILEKTK